MSDARRFDQAEFERILRRAVELQDEEGDRHFDEADVVSAGRELGIPDRVTQAAAREVLGPGAAKVERPPGATVRIEQVGDELVVHAPRLGTGGRRGRTLLIGASWLVAALVWASEVSRSSVGLALLASPFVLLAVARLGPILRAMLESAELHVGSRMAELTRRIGPLSWHTSFDPAHLCARIARDTAGTFEPHHHLLLEDRHVRAAILRSRPPGELLWVDAELGAWLAKLRTPIAE